MSDSSRAAELIRDLSVDNVKTLLQKSDIRGRLVTKKLSVPEPGFTLRRDLWSDYQNGTITNFKVEPGKSVPFTLLSHKTLVRDDAVRTNEKQRSHTDEETHPKIHVDHFLFNLERLTTSAPAPGQSERPPEK